MIDDTSSYACDCGEVSELNLNKEYEYDILYKGKCPKCGRVVFEHRTHPDRKRPSSRRQK